MNANTSADESGSVDEQRAQYEQFSLTAVKGGVGYINVRNDSYGDESGSHIYSVEVDHGEAVGCSCPHATYRDAHCKHQIVVENNPLVLTAADATATDTRVLTDGGEKESEDDDLPEVTRHVEAPEFGGATYVRCEGCQNESVGGENHLLHKHDCPHNDDSGTTVDANGDRVPSRTEKADFGGGEGGIDAL